ncbi:hypothetical protein ACN2C7_09195 [Caulobacter sp. ErkDOM-E]|uniref:hypothetical protein n=1 Tax=Caulobacter sp. ErkDOM-E TaxID=3402778 RepID=UPI003AF6EB4F
MPKPRTPRPGPKLPTRSRNQRAHSEERLKKKLIERLAALADMYERRSRNTYRDNIGAFIYLNEGDPVPEGLIKVEYDKNGLETPPYAKEKAPGLAAEGSVDFVIPAEEPRPPRMRRLD